MMLIRFQNIVNGFLGTFLLLLLALPAWAHIGPPFPIIENKKVGPCVIDLWTHPDIGTGTFYVMVNPAPGSKIPSDLKVKVGVQPESGRLPEVFYNGERNDTRDQVEYKVLADFDRDEFWRVHLILDSSQGQGEVFSRVEATPTAFGRFGLLFFLLPFLAIAFLWYRGMSKKRKRIQKRREVVQAQSSG